TVENDDCIDLLIGNNKKKDIVTIIEDFIEMKEASTTDEEKLFDKTLQHTTVIDINDTHEYEELHLKQTADHTRAYMKIQDGCNQFCSYCIIPFARGRVRSRDKDSILTEAKDLVLSGYQELVLTGIHISSYGVDFDKKEALIELIEKLHSIDGLMRIRIGSLEPRIMTPDFVKRLAKLPKVCPHFHLSLQSGCDETLKRMNRRYDTKEYFEAVTLLREFYTNPAITTDVIVGFPQESQEEFEQSAAFLKKTAFYEMHIFKFSKRHGTVAAKLPGQITDEVKTDRSNQLLKLATLQSHTFREQYIGRTVQVLFEERKEIDGKTWQIGHTMEYIKVAYESKRDLGNQIFSGVIEEFLTEDIMKLNMSNTKE
ncbi:MAG: MiaB/RimO family radical SAM methylthiotransferase, partial [Clostridiales bacterium]|nr:MiaB/RimO family radical SAM methylthiotransferase [Clostridiales bacterium]